MTDWHHWLARYDKPQSPHSQRLVTVRRLIASTIDRTAPDPISALSICAGDGRDILQVLTERSDASRVTATLVELDPRLCALARAQASQNGLSGIDVMEADAGATDTYAGLLRADLVILVGVFGNIPDPDVRTTIGILPALCKRDALVIWSLRQQPRQDRDPSESHRDRDTQPQHNDRDRVARVNAWFDGEGFDAVFANHADAAFHVGAHRFVGTSRPLPAGQRFFAFALPPNPGLKP